MGRIGDGQPHWLMGRSRKGRSHQLASHASRGMQAPSSSSHLLCADSPAYMCGESSLVLKAQKTNMHACRIQRQPAGCDLSSSSTRRQQGVQQWSEFIEALHHRGRASQGSPVVEDRIQAFCAAHTHASRKDESLCHDHTYDDRLPAFLVPDMSGSSAEKAIESSLLVSRPHGSLRLSEGAHLVWRPSSGSR